MLLNEHFFAFLEQNLLGALVQIQTNAFLLLFETLAHFFHVLRDRILTHKLRALARIIVLGARYERRFEVLFVDFERRLFRLFYVGLV